MQSTMMPEGIPVKFKGQEYRLVPVSLRKIKAFIEKVAVIFSLAELETLMASGEPSRAMQKLQEAPDTLAELVEIAAGIPKEEALDATLHEAVDIVFKAIEINNAVKILTDAIKKARAPKESGAQ